MTRKSGSLTNEFSAFLEIDRLHLKIVHRYRELLAQGADKFAARFYDYLFKFPATSKLLKHYQKEGGDIAALMQKQVAHLLAMIGNDDDPGYQARPIYISLTAREISPICMDLPIPCLAWTVEEDRPKVEAAWREALAGKTVAAGVARME